MSPFDALPRFTDLTLILTDHCNLSCPFCYVPSEASRTMTPELARRAVDLLVDRAPAASPLSVSFFGGEPFLQRELMAEVLAHATARRPDGSIFFATPTNGTLLDDDARELVRRYRVRLALSVDADDRAHGLKRLDPGFGELRELADIVRVTVTPDDVDALFETIGALDARGVRRIMHQPALEQRWPEAAVQSWREQHALIADWACERYAERKPLPELTVLEGIVTRLERGIAPGFCGAGSKQLAVDPAGRVFGCFRSAYDPAAERLVLADLVQGTVNEPLLAAYARLDPARARPEQGPCKDCAARDGCTAFCPAAGHVVCGDLRAVPRDACELMQIQVDLCRDILRRMRKSDRAARRRIGQRAAAAAVALGLAGGLAACDARPPVSGHDAAMGGLCAVQVDAAPDGPIAGVCPINQPDRGVVDDRASDLLVQHDAIVPGQCPYQPDGMIGGLCPIMPDAAPDPDGPIGGLCPAPGIC